MHVSRLKVFKPLKYKRILEGLYVGLHSLRGLRGLRA